MPHAARRKSASGYYHVVPKGINDHVIFEDDEDRSLYVDFLGVAKRCYGVVIHAYCLMSNHTHLVLEDPHDHLSDFMKFVDERYGTYVAEKTGRTGGILRKPYWSEPIETDGYLLCAVRYVHANPAAAGICPASVYRWSSAKDYLGREGIADVQTVLTMLDGKEGFIEWSRAGNSTALPFPGSKLRAHLSDDEAGAILKAILGSDEKSLMRMDVRERTPILSMLRERGFTTRQLARITGLGTGEINRA